jgi:diaminopimelate decarboxylase
VNNNPFWMTNRLALFPESTRVRDDSLFIAGHSLAALAADHGTPLYIYDRATLDLAVADYQSALRAYYPAKSTITYAGKAFLCKAIAQWTQHHNLLVDCTGEGEIGIAVAGGVPCENILVHGVNKSGKDLNAALQHAETIVVDNDGIKRIHVTLSVAKSSYRDERDSSVQQSLLHRPGVPSGE